MVDSGLVIQPTPTSHHLLTRSPIEDRSTYRPKCTTTLYTWLSMGMFRYTTDERSGLIFTTEIRFQIKKLNVLFLTCTKSRTAINRHNFSQAWLNKRNMPGWKTPHLYAQDIRTTAFGDKRYIFLAEIFICQV